MIEDGEEESIPLHTITKKTLKKIVEYCQWIHENSEPTINPLRSKTFNEIVPNEWLQNYITIDKEFLFEIALAANFLNISSLLELTSAKIASDIKGKSIEENRAYFGVKADFKEGEE